MKKSFFIIPISILLTLSLKAQHCPFDGSNLILIKVKNKADTTRFTLKEIDNPKADSCRYAEGLLSMEFKNVDSFYTTNHWIKDWETQIEATPVSELGHFYVRLNQATHDCMIPVGNNYRYIKRQFVIEYFNTKNQKLEQMEVPEKSIYNLCKSAKNWGKFKAIEIDY
jgi:hypothetical protein